MDYHSPRWWRREGRSHERLDVKLVETLSGKKFPSYRQLRYLSRVLSPHEYRAVQVLVAVIAFNLLFLGFRFYTSATVESPAAGGHYTEALVGSPQTINPILLASNDVDRDLSRLLYAGLMRYTANGTVEQDLAESVSVSPDGKTVTFALRKNLLWQDGKPLTADDVIFTVDRIRDSAYKSPLAASFSDIAVEKVDDATIRFSLKVPFAPFLDLMTVGIVPKHAWESVAPEAFALSSLNLRPIGSGAWKFKSLQKDRDGTIRSYTLSRNEYAYAPVSYLSELTFRFYPDIDSAVQSLKNRSVQGISFLPRNLRDKLSRDRDLGTYVFNLPQYTAVFFNQLNNSNLKSLAVRQALALTIDRDRIVREALNGEGVRIGGPILLGFAGYDPAVRGADFNVDKAASMLMAAGWKKNEAGQWEKADKDKKQRLLSLVLTTVNQDENIRVADILKEGWTRAGFSVEVQLVDPSRVKQDVIDGRNYEAFLYGEIVGSDPDLYPFWHSSQALSPGLNLALYSNAKADALLESGRTTMDQSKRADIYRSFQSVLLQSIPAVFLYSPTYNYVVNKNIRGITDKKKIVTPSDRFIDINSWYAKTHRTWKK